MSERERFEEWAKSIGRTVAKLHDGEYADLAVHYAWQAWQAARAWRPIREAPKDGTEIIAWREDAGSFIARWVCCYEFMTDAECDGSGMNDDQLSEPDWFYADFIQGGRLDGDLAPTHWQPLPPPPEAES